MQGNVEHFSICSDDSIWHEAENLANDYEKQSIINNNNHHYHQHHPQKFDDFYSYEENYHKNSTSDHCYTEQNNNNNNNTNNNNEDDESQCFFISSTTSENELLLDQNPFSQQVNKYKSHIMEKYLRDCQKPENQLLKADGINYANNNNDKPSMISKWLESAANFKPSQNNYLNWTFSNKTHRNKKTRKIDRNHVNGNYNHEQQHGREELDAAEALTKLANAYNSRKAI